MKALQGFGNGVLFSTFSAIVTSFLVSVISAFFEPKESFIGALVFTFISMSAFAIVITFLASLFIALPVAFLLRMFSLFNAPLLCLCGLVIGFLLGYFEWLFPRSWTWTSIATVAGFLASYFFWKGVVHANGVSS